MATGINTQYARTSRTGAILSPPRHRSAYPNTSATAAAPPQSNLGESARDAGPAGAPDSTGVLAATFGMVAKCTGPGLRVSSESVPFNPLLIQCLAQGMAELPTR